MGYKDFYKLGSALNAFEARKREEISAAESEKAQALVRILKANRVFTDVFGPEFQQVKEYLAKRGYNRTEVVPNHEARLHLGCIPVPKLIFKFTPETSALSDACDFPTSELQFQYESEGKINISAVIRNLSKDNSVHSDEKCDDLTISIDVSGGNNAPLVANEDDPSSVNEIFKEYVRSIFITFIKKVLEKN